MWSSKSIFMSIRVRVRTAKRRIRIRLFMALNVFHQLLLSFEGAVAITPGKAGIYASAVYDTIHGIVIFIIGAEPEEFVRVSLDTKEGDVDVCVKSMGFGGR